jgi:branched-chain amino acid aminotransferase
MSFKPTEKIWMNGKLVDWGEAKIHVLSHVVHYGSSVFEGIRCYRTKKGSAIFRMRAHTERLFNSAKIYHMEIPFTQEQINKAMMETVKSNKLAECYIRPVVYRGYDHLGVDPTGCPIDVAIAVWEWGKYLPNSTACVSSWVKIAPNTLPAMAKSGANYMNSQLIKLEALSHGYGEGIALDAYGYVSEGSGENIFIVRDKALITPPYAASILPGITRNTVITLAQELGYKVIEENIPREALYVAGEVFFTGTAAEISPVTHIDKVKIGCGEPGQITKSLQARFRGIVTAEEPDKWGWLTFLS